LCFFFSSRRRHTRFSRDWSSDVCSSDLIERHFLAMLPGSADAIITDTKKVVNTLNSLCIEMDQRYELLKHAQVRNIKEYNSKFRSEERRVGKQCKSRRGRQQNDNGRIMT